MKKSHGAKSGIVDASTMVFVYWPNNALQTMLCGKAHSHDAKSTHLVKDLMFLMNVQPHFKTCKQNARLFVCFGGT
jgi:hypothetical protein